MNPCCICGDAINSANPESLFTGKAGDSKEICDTCAHQMDILLETDNRSQLQSVVHYLNACIPYTQPEVTTYLRKIIDNMYFLMTDTEKPGHQSIWLSYTKVIAWLGFSVMIVAGLVIQGILDYKHSVMGFFIFLLSVLVATGYLGGMMAVSGLAHEVSELKKILRKGRDQSDS